MTREERTRQRKEFDAAFAAYERACELYVDESAKWERAWRDAGREPPATTRVEPKRPEATWAIARRAAGWAPKAITSAERVAELAINRACRKARGSDDEH